MKKGIVIWLFCLLISVVAYAQDVTWNYFQNDYYKGVACAGYLSEAQAKKIGQRLKNIKISRSIEKLSKLNSWLCWKALSKWDIIPGEKYIVATASSWYSSEVLILIVTISDKDKFYWEGCIVPTISHTEDPVLDTVQYLLNTFTK